MSQYVMSYNVKNLRKYDALKDNQVLRILYNELVDEICKQEHHEELIDRYCVPENPYGDYSSLMLRDLGKDSVSFQLSGERVIWLISTFWKYVSLKKSLKDIILIFEYGYDGSDISKKIVSIDDIEITDKEKNFFKKVEHAYENINKINGYHILVKFNYNFNNLDYDYILENEQPKIGGLVETSKDHYGLILNYSKQAFTELIYYKKCSKVIDIKDGLKKQTVLEDKDLLSLCCRYHINAQNYDMASKIMVYIKEPSTMDFISQLLLKYRVSDCAFLVFANNEWINDELTLKIIKKRSWEAKEIRDLRKRIISKQ